MNKVIKTEEANGRIKKMEEFESSLIERLK
jgi:hypothetical protein